MSDTWTPFKRNGKLRAVFATDPWRKRLYARIRRQPIWHQMGYMTDDGASGVSHVSSIE